MPAYYLGSIKPGVHPQSFVTVTFQAGQAGWCRALVGAWNALPRINFRVSTCQARRDSEAGRISGDASSPASSHPPSRPRACLRGRSQRVEPDSVRRAVSPGVRGHCLDHALISTCKFRVLDLAVHQHASTLARCPHRPLPRPYKVDTWRPLPRSLSRHSDTPPVVCVTANALSNSELRAFDG
jgi:hypothetical protein